MTLGIAIAFTFAIYGILTLLLGFVISELYWDFSWASALFTRLAEWTLYLFLAAALLGVDLAIYKGFMQ